MTIEVGASTRSKKRKRDTTERFKKMASIVTTPRSGGGI
jgi:hypothetical protein